jgi:hypothetical protein
MTQNEVERAAVVAWVKGLKCEYAAVLDKYEGKGTSEHDCCVVMLETVWKNIEGGSHWKNLGVGPDGCHGRRKGSDKMTTRHEPTASEKYVIVSCMDGCFYAGFLSSILPPVVLTRCRQLLRWNAKSWFDLAVEGPINADECLFSSAVERAYLFGVDEIVQCSKAAMWAILAVPRPGNCEVSNDG